MAAHHIDPQREIELRNKIETALAKNTGPVNLELRVNGDNDLFTVVELLKKDTRVIKLILSDSSITNHGAEAIADLLHHNKTIQSLDLSYNKIGDAGLEKIREAVKSSGKLTHLSFGGNYSFTFAGVESFFERLGDIPHLTSLSYSRERDGMVEIIAEKVARNKTLTSFEYFGLDDDRLETLSKVLKNNDTLKTVRFTHGEIGDNGAQQLAAALKRDSNLQTLDLSGNQLGDQGARILAEALQHLPNFRTLILKDNAQITADGISALNPKGKFTVIANSTLKRKRNDTPELAPKEKDRKIERLSYEFSFLGRSAAPQSAAPQSATLQSEADAEKLQPKGPPLSR